MATHIEMTDLFGYIALQARMWGGPAAECKMDAHRRWAVANRNVRNPLRDRSRNCFRVYISDRRLINSILARVVFARARTRGNFKRSVFSAVTHLTFVSSVCPWHPTPFTTDENCREFCVREGLILRPNSNVARLFCIQKTVRINYSDTLLIYAKTEG